ncbi:MAG: MFS transporter, partial [Bryobacteraceae bacterium]
MRLRGPQSHGRRRGRGTSGGGAELSQSNRREQRGWYFYDWANSAFYTTVVTVLFGPYLTALARASAGPDGRVSLFGWSLPAGSIWPYLLSISVVMQVVALPIVGAVGDYSRRKREMLGIFAWTGASATVLLCLVDNNSWKLGCVLF